MPTDGLIKGEWHLKNTGPNGGTAGIELNVTAVWNDYTGTRVSIGIYDDAVDYNQRDLTDSQTGLEIQSLNKILEFPVVSDRMKKHIEVAS